MTTISQRLASRNPLPAPAAPASVDPSLVLAEAGDAYLASIRRQVAAAPAVRDPAAYAAFDAAVDDVVTATGGGPFAVRALVRQLVFDLAQARSEAGIRDRILAILDGPTP